MITREAEAGAEVAFDPKKCIATSIRNYSPYIQPLIYRGEFEKAILADEIVILPRPEGANESYEQKITFPALDSWIAERQTQLLEEHKGTPLTPEAIVTRRKQTHEDMIATVAEMAYHADAREKTTMAVADVKVNLIDSFWFESFLKNRSYRFLSNYRFEITKDQRVILIEAPPVKTATEPGSVSVVDLNLLFERDSEFVREKIRTYHKLANYNSLLRKVELNLARHNVDDLLPGFLEKEPTPKDVEDIIRFISHCQVPNFLDSMSLAKFNRRHLQN